MSEGQKMSTDKLQATIAEILSEPPLISTNTEPSPPTFFDEEPAEQTPVDAPADAGNLAIRAEQAKSLLAGLDLDTAIRLRWAMRDIRGKRTKMLPVSENDLAALIDLGFVEMREGIPRLSGLSVTSLQHHRRVALGQQVAGAREPVVFLPVNGFVRHRLTDLPAQDPEIDGVQRQLAHALIPTCIHCF